jgi:multiple inositol-polyphosphate phosphatase / 2,3-bisphosphoglycerate 3-phosphatase
LAHFHFFIAPVEKHVPGSFEKARLRFAHAETVVPFSCLLGLFLEESGEAFKVFS